MATRLEKSVNLSTEICSKFNVTKLNVLQERVLEAYEEGKDVLICSKTGSGKSLMYQQTILAAKCDRPIHIVIVLVPLLSIMIEHVKTLQDLGFSATYIGRDVGENELILNGEYEFIYGSPEEFVSKDKWRGMIYNLRDRISAIVVDEAHTVINWGEAKANEDPFREWFSKIGEIRSLCPGVQVLAGTATANQDKRKKIMKSLCMNILFTSAIVDSPDRENIKLSIKLVKANHDSKETFQWLLESLNPDLPRQLLFCRTIRECGTLFLALKDYKHEAGGLVEMYHSKTPTRIQDRIRKDMGDPNGKIRVLVATNAAGMGVNFANLNSVIHYGPPVDTDTFLQQIGRAGRDGTQADHILIYHKRQLKKAESPILEYVNNTTKCRREVLLANYMAKPTDSITKHLCCDVCSEECSDCSVIDCVVAFFHPLANALNLELDEYAGDTLHRMSTERQRGNLKDMLLQFRDSLSEAEFTGKLVVTDEAVHGFSVDLVNEIVEKCDSISSSMDIISKTSIMSSSQAMAVADIFEVVFSGTFL